MRIRHVASTVPKHDSESLDFTPVLHKHAVDVYSPPTSSHLIGTEFNPHLSFLTGTTQLPVDTNNLK